MIYRIDVRTMPAARGGDAAVDPVGEALRHQIREFGSNVGGITTARVFLIDTDASRDQAQSAASQPLADPAVEAADVSVQPAAESGASRIEMQLKPGVMEP